MEKHEILEVEIMKSKQYIKETRNDVKTVKTDKEDGRKEEAIRRNER